MAVICDRCKKRANIFTVIGTFQYCDKCVGLVRHTVRKLLTRFNDKPNIILSALTRMYQRLDHPLTVKTK